MEILSCSASDTISAGQSLGQILKTGSAVLFRKSPMGSGKTYFTKGIALSLGVKDEVTSPTFAVVNEYSCGSLTLFHFDLYRLSDSSDLYTLGIDDYLRRCEKNGVAVFEWYDNPEWLWLKNEFERVHFVEIEVVPESGHRKIKIT
jgi:tRNA threonylcarbamoyladenosine biosynthesis protein TsaE